MWSVYIFILLLNARESVGSSGKEWFLEMASSSSSLHNWSITTASIFVITALMLSLYLIFEHLAAYNQPEVRSCSSVGSLSFSIVILMLVFLVMLYYILMCG